VSIGRILIVAGVLLIVVGLAWPWLAKLPLGRLPGDIAIERPHVRFYFPVTTMIVVSLVVTFLLWLFRR
jgi:hypothetical protein